MSRIVLGNRDGSLAIQQARTVLHALSEEWTNLHFTLRTISEQSLASSANLIAAVQSGSITGALVPAETLTDPLPDDVIVCSTPRRQEPRSALIAKGNARSLADLPNGVRIAVSTERDAIFARTQLPHAHVTVLSEGVSAQLRALAHDETDALIAPAARLAALDQRARIDALLDPEVYPPAAGQGALALIVQAGDDMAFDTLYTISHRPSLIRLQAELAFRHGLTIDGVGAFSNVSDDGDLTLTGSVIVGDVTLQGVISGDAREARQLGRELAEDMNEQLGQLDD